MVCCLTERLLERKVINMESDAPVVIAIVLGFVGLIIACVIKARQVYKELKEVDEERDVQD